eukprot:jgi/Galph1/3508/GphlegSOOS_G2146.1
MASDLEHNNHEGKSTFKEPDPKEPVAKFDVSYAEQVAREIIEQTVGEENYEHSKTVEWTNQICEKILNKMVEQGKPFKYIVSCSLLQRRGAGFHTATTCYWDAECDQCCTVKHETKQIYVICTVYAISLP